MNTLPSVFVSHPHRFRLSKKHLLDMAVSTTHFSHLKGLSQVSITSSPSPPHPPSPHRVVQNLALGTSQPESRL